MDPLLNQFDDVPVEQIQSLNRDLFSVLASLIEGEALDIITNSAEGEGFEAWRKLVKNFDPQSAGRRRNILKSLMNPPQAQLAELRSQIEKWEKRISEYKRRSGSQPIS